MTRKIRVAAALSVVAVAALGLTVAIVYRWVLVAILFGHVIEWPGHGVERVIVSTAPFLVADHYPAGRGAPLIVLAHGSHPTGRRHAMPRRLAESFNQSGYRVLVPDMPGFGESAGVAASSAGDYALRTAVLAAARWARDTGLAGPDDTIYAGHSLGAVVALRAASTEPSPAAVVALGAPQFRRFFEKGGQTWLDGFARQRLENIGATANSGAIEAMSRYLLSLDPVVLLSESPHPPALLVYGQREQRLDLPAAREFRRRRRPGSATVGLFVVPAVPHSLGVSGGPWGSVLHEPEALEHVLRAGDAWAQHWLSRRSTSARIREANGAESRFLVEDAIALARQPWPSLGDLGTFPRGGRIQIPVRGTSHLGGPSNPFDVTLEARLRSPDDRRLDIPGFFDGGSPPRAAGNLWAFRLSAHRTGRWTFEVASSDPMLDGHTGSFEVIEPAPDAPSFLTQGRLQYTGGHYLKFTDGPYWLKVGADEPEDFLADRWGNLEEKKEVVDYLAERGINSMYVLLQNVDGDGNNVWPWAERKDSSRFDVARLAVWEELFSHMQERGLALHLVLEDDSGWTGFDRSRYYREMVARFGHHNALIWNLVEEYNERYSADEIRQWARLLSELDPYDHPITVHHGKGTATWEPFLGDELFDLTSLQTGPAPQNAETVSWRRRTAASGRPLVISIDETGRLGLDQRAEARAIAWSVLMGGGMFELFVRDLHDHGFRAYDAFWSDMGRARRFFDRLALHEMTPDNDRVAGSSSGVYCLSGKDTIAIYLERASVVDVDLADQTGIFRVTWYEPFSGRFVEGNTIAAGGTVRLAPPGAREDIAAILTRDSADGAPR